jgi:N-acetyl sugar amidotransferase
MDTTDPDIEFDKNGYCNHCTQALNKLRSLPSEHEKAKRLASLVEEIKKKGQGKKYDCIIGVSGGVDSSFVAYEVKKLGLRPLAVHLDNGWDSELAVKNIENICNILKIDLFTHVINWEEFKDLQLSFLKSSTPDSEIPSDHAITAILFHTALKEGVKYILIGTNVATESIGVNAWSQGHADWKYIESIQEQFGSKQLETFPHYSIFNLMTWKILNGIKLIQLLDYIDYNKQEAKNILQQGIEWRDYGDKHHESVYTKFFQAHILPTKFGFDKRRTHLSSLICANQITRDQALEEMKKNIYPPQELKEHIDYVINKFGLTREQFDTIMKTPPKTYWDYPNYKKTWYYKTGRALYRTAKRIRGS